MNNQRSRKALRQVLILSGLFLGILSITVVYGIVTGALRMVLYAVLRIESEFLHICVHAFGIMLVVVLVHAWISRWIQSSTTFTSVHEIQQERIAQPSPEQRSAYRRALGFNIAVVFLSLLVVGTISYYLLPLLQVFVFGRQPDTLFFIPIFPLSFGVLSAFGLIPILCFFVEPLSQRVAKEHWESIRDIMGLHVPGTEHISNRMVCYALLPLTFICWVCLFSASFATQGSHLRGWQLIAFGV